MTSYECHIICDDGEQEVVYVFMDPDDPLFEQAVALTAAELGYRFASIDTIVVEDEE